MERDYQDSVINLAEKIRSKAMSAFELVSAYSEQIARINPKINAIVVDKRETALQQAKQYDDLLAKGQCLGPLHGIPFTLKDIYNTQGDIVTAGCLGLKDNIAQSDATLVQRLKNAGAILLGKTNTPELENANDTDNLVYGYTSNPYDFEYSAGGSSGGSAAAIASCCSAFDVGSDIGSSLRIPAHYCGIASIRPTVNRIPSTGVYCGLRTGVMGMFTTEGPLARSVADLHLLLRIIQGPDQQDPRTLALPLYEMESVNLKTCRIAYFFDNGIVRPNQQTIASLKKASDVLKEAGATVTEALPACLSRGHEVLLNVLGARASAAFSQAITDMQVPASPLLSKLIQYLEPYRCDISTFSNRFDAWDLFRSDVFQFFQTHDVLLCPVAPGSALNKNTTMWDDQFELASYTWAISATLLPTVVVRIGTDDNHLPIGTQVIAKLGCEHQALAVAHALEKNLGGWRYPENLEAVS